MLTLQINGLRFYNDKSVIAKSWHIVRQKRTTVPKVEQRDTVDYLLGRITIHFGYSFQQYQTCQLQLKTFVLPIQRVQYDVREER